LGRTSNKLEESLDEREQLPEKSPESRIDRLALEKGSHHIVVDATVR
jgi:hypothetical protein